MNIEQSSLCYSVGPCWLSILSIVAKSLQSCLTLCDPIDGSVSIPNSLTIPFPDPLCHSPIPMWKLYSPQGIRRWSLWEVAEIRWGCEGGVLMNGVNSLVTICPCNYLEEMGNPHSQQKSLKCSTWVQSQKWQHDLCLFPRQTIQYHSNPSLCPNH